MSTGSCERHPAETSAQQIGVAPVELAFVHLDKPHDVAVVGQIAAATGHMAVDLVGQAMGFDHPKVLAKLRSWNMSGPATRLDGVSSRFADLDDLRAQRGQARLIGAVVRGGKNPFTYNWQDNDIIVIGGAEGLSGQNIDKMDDLITIPLAHGVEFLTVSVVVSALTYHILTRRGLWKSESQAKAQQ